MRFNQIAEFACILMLLAAFGELDAKSRPSPRAAQSFPTMTAAIDEITTQYKTRVGLEYASNDVDRTPINLDISESAIAKVLDSLVAQKPDYSWELIDGIYDIHPKAVSDSILSVHIRAFSVTGATGREVSEAISLIPEVKEWMLRHGVQRRELETGSRWAESDPRVTLHLKDTSLRSLLNRVVKERQVKEWIVVRYGDKQQYLAIYI